jgi:hypothetical protein
MIDALAPMAWTDLVMPVQPPDTEWFDFYTEWLSDHLFSNKISVHPRQVEYVQQMLENKPQDYIFWISDSYGYAIDELESLQRSFAELPDWPSFAADEKKAWDSSAEDAIANEWTFEDWATSRATWERCHDEWLELQQITARCGAPPDHADIPFRALLSTGIKHIPQREKRIEEIRYYFRNFTENASK